MVLQVGAGAVAGYHGEGCGEFRYQALCKHRVAYVMPELPEAEASRRLIEQVEHRRELLYD